MNQDFSELVKYLDEKFVKIDEKFSNVTERLIEADEKLESLRENKADQSDIDNLMGTVDGYAKKSRCLLSRNGGFIP